MNKDVCSYDLAVKLKQLGYKTKGAFEISKENEMVLNINREDRYYEYINAPTVGEIMSILPSHIDDKFLAIYKDKEYIVVYGTQGNELCMDGRLYKDKSLPNALAKMLIWVIEEGYLTLNSKDEYKH